VTLCNLDLFLISLHSPFVEDRLSPTGDDPGREDDLFSTVVLG